MLDQNNLEGKKRVQGEKRVFYGWVIDSRVWNSWIIAPQKITTREGAGWAEGAREAIPSFSWILFMFYVWEMASHKALFGLLRFGVAVSRHVRGFLDLFTNVLLILN